MRATFTPARVVASTLLVFVVLEVTAAAWHLLLFRELYAAETAVMDRSLGEYVVPYLMIVNLLRALALVALFRWAFSKGGLTYARGVQLGALVGLVSGLVAAEYFGVWRFRSLAWPAMEGGWLVGQGIAVGLALTWALSFRRGPAPPDAPRFPGELGA